MRHVGHPDRPGTLLHLAKVLLYRYGELGLEEFPGEIVEFASEVQASCSMVSHERRAADLALQTYALYKAIKSGSLADIDKLIPTLRRAVEDIPHDYFDKPQRLTNLGLALGVRYEFCGYHGDLDESIATHKEAMQLTPCDLDSPTHLQFLKEWARAALAGGSWKDALVTSVSISFSSDLRSGPDTLGLDKSNRSQCAPFQMASVNIVLFGEKGVGKSSVINLIAGHQVASVSPDANGRPLSSKRYSLPVGGRAFRIWDTAGLEQPEIGAVGYMAAIEGALALIQQLAQQGGVDLLLFCMRGHRVTATTLSNYRLFYEVLCRSQVPIALVITHLEREPDMNAWWTRNLHSLEKRGIKPAGHACVTGLPTHSKYPESKASIERMLRGYNGQGKYIMPADSWFIEFLRSFGRFAPPKKELKEEELLKVLTKRCKLSPKIAQELAERLAGHEGGVLD